MRRRASVVLLIVLVAMVCFGKSKKVAPEPRVYRTVVPLGILKFTPNSEPRSMYVLVTAENPAFQNWETSEDRRMPRRLDGTPIKYFPQHIDFRVTATARTSELIGIDDYPITIPPGSLNEFMCKLRFRVAIYHGLDKRVLDPSNVDVLGMPVDVSYDERIYRVGFDVGAQVPVADRIVLEVLSPGGDRLGKFHLEF